MNSSKYSFRIEYQNGLQVEIFDNHDKDSKFRCFVYVYNQKLKSKLLKKYPEINISGYFCPPFKGRLHHQAPRDYLLTSVRRT